MTPREQGHAQQRARHEQEILRQIHLNAAGIDIGSASHWVAVPDDRDDQPVREFTSFTHDLTALATWLEACGIDTVAMESTGVYWIPLYELLEARGIEVLLVNAHHVKGVPGRKSDILDCQWLQQLHTFGLLRGSFRPDAPIAALRSVIRHRDQLVASAASWVQRMQKALVLMNLQLHHVLTDVTGVTGVAILRDIVAGETDSAVLARHRDPRCKAPAAEIAAALTGHYRAEHVFVLRQALEGYDFYQTQIGRCDDEIQGQIRALEATCQPPDEPPDPPRPARRRSANEPRFEIRAPLYTLCAGVDLTAIPGLGPYGALKLVSEIGVDMRRWATEKHFTSWLTLPRPGAVWGAQTRVRDRRRYASLGDGEALHLVAHPRAPEPDLRGQAPQLPHATVGQSGGKDPPPGRHESRAQRSRARRVLPAARRPRRQGQGDHGDGPQARHPGVSHAPGPPPLPRAHGRRLRPTAAIADPARPPEARRLAGVRTHRRQDWSRHVDVFSRVAESGAKAWGHSRVRNSGQGEADQLRDITANGQGNELPAFMHIGHRSADNARREVD